ncbi:signal peptide peptidase 2B-like, partial [Tropilaelaps mercedesae]
VYWLPGNFLIRAPGFGYLNPLRALLLTVPITSAVVWYIRRTEYNRIWPLHNFMAAVMCVWLISYVRLPSLSVAAVVALLLGLYDFFMVYVTPRFTYDGKSVMETVARGGKKGEVLPMVVHVPSFSYGDKYQGCTGPIVGLIGMGDLIIPGFIVAYCGVVDAYCRRGESCKLSFLALGAYAAGLIITYIVK